MLLKTIKLIVKRILPIFVLEYILDSISLSKRPDELKAVISDQFPYRNGNWKTYFELLNLPRLFDPVDSDKPYIARLVFFDQDGEILYTHEILNHDIGRITLDLSLIFPSLPLIGTFACFHNSYSNWLQNEKAYLAERGYVGYQNTKLSKTKGYVHGNFDAIAEDSKHSLMSLGTSNFRNREYWLQHELTGPALYELLFVNTTNSIQKITIKCGEANSFVAVLSIPSRGIRIFNCPVRTGESLRVKILSRLNMARPVVFRSTENSFDVFHG
jgi:hypothetical protein